MLTIRHFENGDCEAAFELAGRLGLSPWSIDDYRRELEREDSLMFAAAHGGDLVGFIIGRLVPSSGPAGGLDAEIYNIGVLAAVHRSGIGSKLIERFIGICRKNKVVDIWLEVRAANHAARTFYKNFGFEDFAARPGFYQNPSDDALILRLQASGAGS